MWHASNILTYLLNVVLLFLMLSEDITANDFNKSLEAESLLATNWWEGENVLDHCHWNGIACDEAGSVVEISLYNISLEGNLGSLDFSSFSNLVSLGFYECKLTGSIPEQIGLLSNLTYLAISGNQLTGNLPESFSNLVRLEYLYLDNDNLSGNLLDVFTNLTHLKRLFLSDNKFSGELPISLTNLAYLEYLYLSGNSFTGEFHASFTNLIHLEELDLSRNTFIGNLAASFTNLIHLKLLDLSSNNFSGNLPVSLTHLEYLDLSENKLTGPIPPSYGSMVNLTVLALSTNQLNASIPNELTNLHNLGALYLENNNFDGPIPSRFGNLRQLVYLNLSKNSISGNIPLNMVNLTNLRQLGLSHNNLVGSIHPEFGKLYYLDVSSNRLSGNLSFQYPCNLQYLDLSMNLITGSSRSILFCNRLQYLDLSSNNFVGKELDNSRFPDLEFLNQSQHHHTAIQDSITNLSCNSLSGQAACKGHIVRNKLIHKLTIFLPIIVGLCFLLLGYICYKNHKAIKIEIQLETKRHGDVCSILNYDGTIAYEDFIAATEDFDLKYCIGTGGYGSAFEAKLPDGKIFALKKLHRFEAEQPTFNQSFKNEVLVLTNLRHKNIVKLYGFCLHNKCNFLVYEYMEKGSLFYALSDSKLAVEVDWIKRVNIIKDVACALAYYTS